MAKLVAGTSRGRGGISSRHRDLHSWAMVSGARSAQRHEGRGRGLFALWLSIRNLGLSPDYGAIGIEDREWHDAGASAIRAAHRYTANTFRLYGSECYRRKRTRT